MKYHKMCIYEIQAGGETIAGNISFFIWSGGGEEYLFKGEGGWSSNSIETEQGSCTQTGNIEKQSDP